MNKKIMQGVEEILKKYPRARESYNWLWYLYCRDIAGIKIYVPFNELDKIPSTESISRAARKIWEERADLLPSKSTREKRDKAEAKMRAELSRNKPLRRVEGGAGWMY